MSTKPSSSKTTTSGSVVLAHSFNPAPVIFKASDYTLTITNKVGKTLTITGVIIDVGQGLQSATFNLAGASVPPDTSQDIITSQLEWMGNLTIAAGASAKILIPGGFTGTAGTITFPSITITSTHKLTTSVFPGPTITVK